MPITINRVPTGLLALLGSKVAGRSPANMLEVVQPGIDFTPFYLAGAMEWQVATVNVAAVGRALSTLVVPQNELWFVHLFTVTCGAGLGAGQAIQIAPAINVTVTGVDRNLQVGEYSTLGATGDQPSAANMYPFVALPGSVFAVAISRLTAGPVNGVGLHAQVARVQI